MKATTIILGILLLIGCASTVQMYRVSTKSTEPKAPIAIQSEEPSNEPKGSGSPRVAAQTEKLALAKKAEEPGISQRREISTKKLFSASLAFSVPDKANIDDDIKAQLLIDTQKELQELEQNLTVSGNKSSNKIQISRVVKATVSAPDFEVTNVTDSEQLILENQTTEWLWTLRPKSVGTHSVNLVITAIITYEGRDKPFHVKTFDKTVTIEITPKQFIKSWLGENWKWVITGLLLPLLGIFAKDIFKKKES